MENNEIGQVPCVLEFRIQLITEVMISIKPPFDPETLYQRALALHQTGKLTEAEGLYRTLLNFYPNQVEVLSNLSVLLLNLGRHNEGESLVKRSLEIQPRQPSLHYNLAVSLQNQARLEEALASYDEALRLNPSDVQSHLNRGITLKDLKRSEDALQSFNKAILLKPDFAGAYWNKALLLLLLGEYKEGWQLYEWGLRCGERGHQRNFTKPRWNGEQPISGKTLLIHAEQGLGDVIQFCRYAIKADALGANVVIEAPAPLTTLLATLGKGIAVVEKGKEPPDYDYYCPLMSLPLVFKTTLGSVPTSIPYLFSSSTKRTMWTKRLGPKTRPRVGLVWSGSMTNKIDLNPCNRRNISLSELLTLTDLPFEFHSLQKEIRPEDALVLSKTTLIKAHHEELNEFADTAALVEEMDLIISVCTSVAHLAGAMGRPTWVLLPFSPDYRWMLARNDSPWYPSMRLFRQTKRGEWDAVFERMAQQL